LVKSVIQTFCSNTDRTVKNHVNSKAAVTAQINNIVMQK